MPHEDHLMRRRFFRLAPLAMLAASLAPIALAEEEEEEDAAVAFEAEIEVGVEAIVSADDPDAENSDVFLSIEAEAEVALTDRVRFFTAFTLESVTDAEDDRAFEDLGLYVGEVGLSFDLDPVTLSIGKISPAFGSAWDTAPGYFGTEFAEDYELEEMIGASAALALGDGTLTLSAFYPDDTRLSDSWGTRRGRNIIQEEGGVGNTGRLDNFALQYDREIGDTTVHVGLRHLAQGEEDNDENGAVIGLTHAFGEDVRVIAEVAHFNGWEGEDATATIATLGASLTRGPVSYSATFSQRRLSDAPTDRLITLGLDYEFDNGMVLSAGIARATEEDEDTDLFGLSLTVPFER